MGEDRDAAVVRWIAAYLDVELTPWQGEFLQTMMRAHRLGQTPVVAKSPRPMCRAIWDNTDPGNVIRCVCSPGHGGDHVTPEGQTWGTS